MEFELSGIIMEINDLQMHSIGREKAQKAQHSRAATKATTEDETGRRCEKMSALLMVRGIVRQALPIDQPATESWPDRIMRDCFTL